MNDYLNKYIDLPKDEWDKISQVCSDTGGDITEVVRQAVDNIIKDYAVLDKKPDWMLALPKGQGAAAIIWRGMLLLRNEVL